MVDKSTGKKFGKSEGNAIWLDPEKTSPFLFYQFWLNQGDEGVVDYLKLFTLLSLEEISVIEADFILNQSARRAQKELALAVTTFVHGSETAQAVANVAEILFSEKDANTLSPLEKNILLINLFQRVSPRSRRDDPRRTQKDFRQPERPAT